MTLTLIRPTRRDRHRLAEADRVAARLAELHQLRVIAAAACELVATGWLQHAWFAYRDDDGAARTVTAATAHLLGDRPVTAACLVGAIVHAGGGLGRVSAQPVRRTLVLGWHTAFAPHGADVQWCPAPPVRAGQVRDLTAWNDAPDRRAGEVVTLLAATGAAADAEIARLR